MAISFSGSAKAEICRNLPQKRCCALAQCFGILLFCNSFSIDVVKIITDSREFAQILPNRKESRLKQGWLTPAHAQRTATADRRKVAKIGAFQPLPDFS